MHARRLRTIFLSTLPMLVAGPYAISGCSSSTTNSTFAPQDGDAGAQDSGTQCFSCGCGDGGAKTVTLDGGLPGMADAGVGTEDAGDGGAPYAGESLPFQVCQSICGAGSASCSVVTVSPTLTVQCRSGCFGGRPPEGLCERGRKVGSVGEYLAEMARLEAASVPAFRRMVRELRSHGAPAALVRAARRSARDEIAHARIVARMAKRFGAEPSRPLIEPLGQRSLFAFALENEVEGCVHETLGALTGMYQAHFAEDAQICAMMKTIAEDESRHAALSHRVSAWARRRLTPAQRHELDVARNDPLQNAERELLDGPLANWQRTLGLPTGSTSRVLLSALVAEHAREAA